MSCTHTRAASGPWVLCLLLWARDIYCQLSISDPCASLGTCKFIIFSVFFLSSTILSRYSFGDKPGPATQYLARVQKQNYDGALLDCTQDTKWTTDWLLQCSDTPPAFGGCRPEGLRLQQVQTAWMDRSASKNYSLVWRRLGHGFIANQPVLLQPGSITWITHSIQRQDLCLGRQAVESFPHVYGARAFQKRLIQLGQMHFWRPCSLAAPPRSPNWHARPSRPKQYFGAVGLTGCAAAPCDSCSGTDLEFAPHICGTEGGLVRSSDRRYRPTYLLHRGWKFHMLFFLIQARNGGERKFHEYIYIYVSICIGHMCIGTWCTCHMYIQIWFLNILLCTYIQNTRWI